jgi:hypothetical protein
MNLQDFETDTLEQLSVRAEAAAMAADAAYVSFQIEARASMGALRISGGYDITRIQDQINAEAAAAAASSDRCAFAGTYAQIVSGAYRAALSERAET